MGTKARRPQSNSFILPLKDVGEFPHYRILYFANRNCHHHLVFLRRIVTLYIKYNPLLDENISHMTAYIFSLDKKIERKRIRTGRVNEEMLSPPS